MACRLVSISAALAREHAPLSTDQGILASVPEHVIGAGQIFPRLHCQGVRGLPEVWPS